MSVDNEKKKQKKQKQDLLNIKTQISDIGSLWISSFYFKIVFCHVYANKMKTYFILFHFQGLKTHKPKVAFFTHGESSGATVQSLEGIGALCHK